MIPGIVAGQMRQFAPVRLAQLIGIAATAPTFTGSEFTVSVPADALAGDTLIAVLRCRADRSFAVPAGWTAQTNGVTVGTAAETGQNTKLYVIHKPFDGETSLTFTQSVSSAALAALIVVRGTIGAVTQQQGVSASRAPTNLQSMLLAIGTSNNSAAATASWSAPFTTGVSHKWSADAPYFYGVTVSTHSSGATASVPAEYAWVSNNPDSNYIWLAEILPPIA